MWGGVRYFEFRNITWGVLYFALLIFLLSNNNTFQNVLSSNALCKLNEISFGVYSFHWPLICSIGALLMIALPSKNGIIASWTICIISSIIVSVFYNNLLIVVKKSIHRFVKNIL